MPIRRQHREKVTRPLLIIVNKAFGRGYYLEQRISAGKNPNLFSFSSAFIRENQRPTVVDYKYSTEFFPPNPSSVMPVPWGSRCQIVPSIRNSRGKGEA